MDLQAELVNYLDAEGHLKEWPSRRNKGRFQQLALAYLAAQFQPGMRYSEKEVNALLNQHHTFGDTALLRRELFERGLVNRVRDGSAYWLVPSDE